MKVLAFIEQRGGKLKKTAFEVLSVAQRLAGSTQDLAAVIVGGKIGHLSKELEGYGTDKVFLIEADSCETYNVMTYATAVEAAIRHFGPAVVVGTASPLGRDLMPRLAARFGAGLLTDVTTLDYGNGKLQATKPMFAGKCLAEVTSQGELHFATIRPNVFPAEKLGKGSAASELLALKPEASKSLTTVEIRKGSSEKADLTEASVIVSGGRAMGSADAFKILHSLGEIIGATVGASRAAVDLGYAPHDMQVGQTGKTVNPNLYIACGISGSIQHMAGMRTSKVIVAINTDAEAPIFTVANYGIVGDLFKVVPILQEKLKSLVAH